MNYMARNRISSSIQQITSDVTHYIFRHYVKLLFGSNLFGLDVTLIVRIGKTWQKKLIWV